MISDRSPLRGDPVPPDAGVGEPERGVRAARTDKGTCVRIPYLASHPQRGGLTGKAM
jgi:hypothetical protein